MDNRTRSGWRNSNARSSCCFEADGGYVQGSYFVIPKKLQLVSKWELFNPDQRPHLVGLSREQPGVRKAEFDEVIVRLQVMF